jgi:ribosomal protein S18 acetylase RimI-like enzyme
MNINIKYAQEQDLEWLVQRDCSISRTTLERKVREKEILVVETESKPIGWLRFNLFWDEIPFMNMLVIEDEFQGKGIGKQLVTFWEEEMRNQGHKYLMTSTQANEKAQHFYRKLGYKERGSFLEPDNESELIFMKKLS